MTEMQGKITSREEDKARREREAVERRERIHKEREGRK